MNLAMGLPVLAAVLFCIGLLIVLVKDNLIHILIGLELMLNSANLNLVAFSAYQADADGQLLVLFVLILAVCEAALGLAVALRAYKFYQTADAGKIDTLKES